MPEFTLAEGSNNGYASTNHNVWCGGARNPVQYTGDIKGGNKYYMYIVFLLDWGYYGDSQSNVTVNNATFEYLWMGFSDRIGFIASVEADHDWDDGVVTKEPTCTEPGTKTLSCKHNGEDWHDADATKENVEIPATGHDWGDWVVTKEATVDEEGEETRTCKVCGETETRPIPKLDPDSDSDSDSDQDSHADSSSDTYDSDSDTDSTDDTSSKKDSKSPETGDETDISLWLTLMAVSFATMAAVARDSRKKNNEK